MQSACGVRTSTHTHEPTHPNTHTSNHTYIHKHARACAHLAPQGRTRPQRAVATQTRTWPCGCGQWQRRLTTACPAPPRDPRSRALLAYEQTSAHTLSNCRPTRCSTTCMHALLNHVHACMPINAHSPRPHHPGHCTQAIAPTY